VVGGGVVVVRVWGWCCYCVGGTVCMCVYKRVCNDVCVSISVCAMMYACIDSDSSL